MSKKKAAEKPKEPETTVVAAKKAVVKTAEKVATRVADAASGVAKAAKTHVVTPVAEAVGLVKPKKARFVREKAEKRPKAAPLTPAPRSGKAAGKMMTKNLAEAPEEKAAGVSKGTRRRK